MEVDPIQAEIACITCRKQKRRCDKLLPSCSLCIRHERRCEYAITSSSRPTAAEFAVLQMRLSELEDRLGTNATLSPIAPMTPPISTASYAVRSSTELSEKPVLTRFPSVLFLDLDWFKWTNTKLPKPQVEIPLVS
jgi:hypothetical protein